MTAVPIPPKLWKELSEANRIIPTGSLFDHFLQDAARADNDDYFVSFQIPQKGDKKRPTDTVPMMAKLYTYLSDPTNRDSILYELNYLTNAVIPETKKEATIEQPKPLPVITREELVKQEFPEEAAEINKVIESIPNKDQKDSLSKMANALSQSRQQSSNPLVQGLYTMSLKSLLSMAETFFKAREMTAKLATPVVLAIELTMGIISLLLLGEEALRHRGYRQNMTIRRKFYERAHVLVQQLPNVSPVDELEKGKTSDQVRQRLRYIMDATSEKSVIQTVEEFLAQFRIVDGTGLNRQPLYTVPVPLHTETMEIQADPKDKAGMQVEYMLYPVRVEEFLTEKDKTLTAVPTVPKRDTGTVFSDVEHSLYEIVAIVKNYTDERKKERDQKEEQDKMIRKEKMLKGEKITMKETNTSEAYNHFFKNLKKTVDSINQQTNSRKMVLRSDSGTLPTTIWQSLYDLFQEEPNKYYLANYFLWAARIIMQSYIKWANHEMVQPGETLSEPVIQSSVEQSNKVEQSNTDKQTQKMNNQSTTVAQPSTSTVSKPVQTTVSQQGTSTVAQPVQTSVAKPGTTPKQAEPKEAVDASTQQDQPNTVIQQENPTPESTTLSDKLEEAAAATVASIASIVAASAS